MIWLCVKPHRISIKIEHRNLEIWKTRNDFSVQVQNFLLPLSLKVFWHKERERHNLSILVFSSSPPPTSHATPAQGLHEQAKVNHLVRSLVSTLSLSSNSQNPPHASGAWRHSHSVTPFSISGYCDISERHVRSARAWTPVLMLHLSNQCTEPKGSQPN